MKYKDMIRRDKLAVVSVSTPIKNDELIGVLKKLSKQMETEMPENLQQSVLTDQDARILLQKMYDYKMKYFSDLPIAHDLSKQFFFNVPRNIVEAIKYFDNHPELPDILNPAILLYLFITEEPASAIGRFWQILMPLIDDNREAIDEDAQAYLADLMDDDTAEEDES